MSTLDNVRAAIVARLASVSNVGRVHSYERYAKGEGEFRALYVADIGSAKQVRGWYVRRAGNKRTRTGGALEILATYEIKGFMGLDDAAESEVALDALVEDVAAAFDADPTLGGLVAFDNGTNENGIQLVTSSPVLFCGVLAHSVVLRIAYRYFAHV